MEEKNPQQNNLNPEVNPDQSPKTETDTTNLNNSAEESPLVDISTKRNETVLDLNAELSKLSSEKDSDIFQKEGGLPRITKEEVIQDISEIKEDDLSDIIQSEKPAQDISKIKEEDLPKMIQEEIIQEIPEIKTPEIQEEINKNIQTESIKEEDISEEAREKATEVFEKEVADKPEGLKETPKKSAKERPISVRTYQSDLVKAVKTKKISLTKAVMMEEATKSNKTFSKIKESTQKNKKKIYLTALSILLILSGISFVFFVYYFKPVPTIKVDNIEITSFVDSDYQKEVFLEKLNSVKLTSLIQTELNKTNLPIGSLLYLYLTNRHLGEDNIIGKKLLTTSELFFLLDARVSESFLRFIEPDFMYGYYSSLDIYPFLILKTRSFDNSFPEMLSWEKNLIEDLRAIFIEDNPAIPSNELRTREFEFKDLLIKNKDTRAILNNSGEIIFIYSFVDKNTIVITTDKNALQEVSNRLILKTQKR